MSDHKASLTTIVSERLSTPSWSGGRGNVGPLGTFLLKQQAAVAAARARRPGATWADVAAAAAAAGVRRQNGEMYSAGAVRAAWHRVLPTEKRSVLQSAIGPPARAKPLSEPDPRQVRATVTSASMPPIRRYGETT